MTKKSLVIISLITLIILAGWYGYNRFYKDKAADEAAVNYDNDQTPRPMISDKNSNLYPAYEIADGVKKWGFIYEDGKFIIPPAYEKTEDFQSNGLAKVYKTYTGDKFQVGLIDKSGKFIVDPVYTSISDFSEGYAVVCESYKFYKVIDDKGKVIFENEGRIGKFSNGAAVFYKKTGTNELAGYIDTNGKVIIEPKYRQAYEFNKDSKALVSPEEDKYYVIDKTGNVLNTLNYRIIREFSDGMLVYYDSAAQKYGYINEAGNIVLGAKYYNVSKITDGFGVVNIAGSTFGGKAGVVNTKGEYVFTPEYSQIFNLGKGLFAIRKRGSDEFDIPVLQPLAIFNSEGKLLTDYVHYSVSEFIDDLAYASDDKYTYFIDKSGKPVSNLPKVEGIGSMKLSGNLIKAEIDDELIYLTKEGKTVWKPELTYKLTAEVAVKELKYRLNRFALISYPCIDGLKDKKIQDTINGQLKKLFVDGRAETGEGKSGDGTSVRDTFSVELNKDLLVINKNGYDFPYGAAHGMPVREYYYINLKDGKFYTIKDLFKPESYYIPKINALISRQINERIKQKDSMFFVEYYKGISDNQHFVLAKDALKIYFYPYEIAAYAAGFPEFDIPYAELMNIIDTSGEFWNSFTKNAGTAIAANTENESKDIMNTVIRIYEQSLVSAINNNTFSYVEPFLLKDSSLYNAQKELVKSLYSQGIQERYVSSQVEKVEADPLRNEYKLYVKEEIAIMYKGKDYETKVFFYIYTAKGLEDKQRYLLSDIKKWERNDKNS